MTNEELDDIEKRIGCDSIEVGRGFGTGHARALVAEVRRLREVVRTRLPDFAELAVPDGPSTIKGVSRHELGAIKREESEAIAGCAEERERCARECDRIATDSRLGRSGVLLDVGVVRAGKEAQACSNAIRALKD